ncbi:MAG: hypothetical protein HN701_14770 [Rhodospirillaceae bacterium]|nr:hypothetical protein [Rhodospirillaceae bacterium]
MKIFIIMITLVVGIIEAKAGFSTGEKLLKFCTADKNGPQGVCSGYIIGVVDSHQTDKVIKGKDEYLNKHLGYRWCLHKKITQGEVMDPVIAWLKVNPKKRHFTATSLVGKALQESFKCDD